ncbi:MAG: EF-P beta-lysylation protein EpmB [Gammaproteobacteria bacterium]
MTLPMIPVPEKAAWRRELASAIRDPADLAERLGLPAAALIGTAGAHEVFRTLVPRGFAARMRKSDPDDALLRQVLPTAQELAPQPARYVTDPLAEADARRAPGLLVKYQGRALLVTSGACAVHCRYCFRRHYPYAGENPRRGHWQAALDAIAADPGLKEVILSGGDPLMLDDTELADISTRLGEIPHVRSLRIHTRLPIVLPERVDEALLGWIEASRLPVTMVVHANHPREIDDNVRAACIRLRPVLQFMLNQAVLLAGVNDDAETLTNLSHALFEAGVLPYYLHLPDAVAGTAHFDVSEARARELIAALRAHLPGYLVPRLAQEIPGAPCKEILA